MKARQRELRLETKVELSYYLRKFLRPKDDEEEDSQASDESDEPVDDNENGVTFIDIHEILEESGAQDDTEEPFGIILPPHSRCASHTLNLLGTTDVNNITKSNKSFGRMYGAAMGKCQALWNLISNRSTKSCEKIEAILGRILKTPCATRWNALYDAVSEIIQNTEKVNEVMVAVGKPTLKDGEILFLKEYVQCMKPIASALDRLQGDKDCLMGELVPSIRSVKKKLEAVSFSERLVYCQPLAEGMLAKLEERFNKFLSFESCSKEDMLAAISHPFFKLRWVPADKQNLLQDMLITAVKEELAKKKTSNGTEQGDDAGIQGRTEETEEFFEFEESAPDGNNEDSRVEVNRFFEDPDKSISMLKRYPNVQCVFRRTNTPIPSSAPVERLFSYGGMIMHPKRRRLGDRLFERLLILKANKNLY